LKTRPIVPARIVFDRGAAWAPDFGDRYHAEAGALEQAEHVFLHGNGLPQRWAGQRRFTIVETGFGLGNNFLATWDAWRRDPQRCTRLDFVSVDRHPPVRADLERAHAASSLAELAQQLVAAWPPLTPNLHRLDFGAVRLLLGFGDVGALLPQLVLRADAFFLDGFAPARNAAMWDRRVFKALARLAAAGATAATWSVARPVRDGLTSVGFEVARAEGFAGKRSMTSARFAPAFAPRRAPARFAEPPTERSALIVGAGVAGAAVAASLAALGWRCTVVDRQQAPAAEASGNPGAIFHATLHADDNPHARWTRAAALHAQRVYDPLIRSGRVGGRIDGLERLGGAADAARWPADLVQAQGDRLFFPGGGWLRPDELIRCWLESPGITFRHGVEVARLERDGPGWRALDADGASIASAGLVVVAAAAEAARLLDPLGAAPMPTERLRGQVTWFETSQHLRHPIAGDGYALDLGDGRVLCGATSRADDPTPFARDEDHRYNLERLKRLTGIEPGAATALLGRVAWRERAGDRLPLAGAVPSATMPPGARLDQVRFIPRIPGLWRLGGLSGRGFSWAPLAAEVLAALIDGAPVPLEADLLDAIDPARGLVRAARRSGALRT
jgi:tRNA 5-methylaminomethyl-2-thiouridine biosynthesis bifunctional protein